MEISLENLYVDIGALRVNSKMSDNKVTKKCKNSPCHKKPLRGQ